MSNKKPSKAELTQQVNSLKVDLLITYKEYMYVRNEVLELKTGYTQWALRAFATAGVKACGFPEDEREIIKEYYDIEAMERLQSYSWFSAFAVLKCCSRKLKKLSRTYYKSKKRVTDFSERIKEIDRTMTERNMNESNAAVYGSLIILRDLVLLIKNEKNLFDRSLLFPCLETPFINGWKMKKHDFLQIISIDKGKRYWDGVQVKPFTERLADIPDEIDFDAFQKLIFIDKIEHDQDCYLFDIFMGDMLKGMNQYKNETGESLLDTFSILKEIAGKPIQTYTATKDEYGDVVGMKPNKPNLKLINGGSIQ
ncbi:MAG: hypothetical protein JWM44_1303 [Bacilli bacterium]|nr:hypothetical protein [Bacilli bacterium]